MSDWARLEETHELPLYPKRGPVLVEGQGCRVTDDEGTTYLDCMTGHGVAALGHCHPRVVEAVCRQASRLITCTTAFANDVRAQLLAALVEVSPIPEAKVFLCNSGTEAIEAALKLARATTGKTTMVAAMRAFHGRSLGALSATHNPSHRKGFEPLLGGFEFIPYNNLEALESAVNDDTAAVLLEPVQGEGGVRPASPEFIRKARTLCDRHQALLIVDEVQTGFGRTGKLFAIEHFDVRPDIMCLAKAMAGGLPMGAVLCRPEIGFGEGRHGTTFGGNPLAAAAALATLEVMRSQSLAARAQERGQQLLDGLRRIDSPLIREVRGLGLMVGIELKQRVTPFLQALMDRHIIAMPAGPTVLRLLPPLIISEAEIDEVLAAVAEVLASPS